MTLGKGFFVLLNFSFVLGFSGILSDNEKIMTESLIGQLNIRSCIILKEHQEKMDHYDFYKTFFNYKITSVIFRRNQLKEYVNAKSFNLKGVKTMVFVRTSSLEKLVPFLKKMQRFLHFFIWWIILDDSVYYNKIPNLPIPYNCKFVFAQSKEPNKYELTEVYNIRQSYFKLIFGTWTKRSGLVQTPEALFLRNRFNFNGTKIVLSGKKVCLTSRECFHREIWNGLGFMLNFRTTLINYLDNPYDIDAKSNPRLFNFAAYKYDTIRPILKIKVYIFIRQPIDKGLPNYFIKPFTTELWTAIFLWIILATLLIVFLELWQKRYLKKEFLIIELIFVPFETFCNQEGSNTPKRLSFRVAYFAVRFLAVFVVPAYSAFLVTYLRIRTPTPPFSNLEEFTQIGTYKLGWVNAMENSYDYYYFKRSNDPLLNKIGEHFLIPKREIKNETQGLAKMCKENYAHMGYVEDIRQTKAPCNVYRIKAPVYSSFTAIALSTRTPYRKIFNMKMVRFYENGVLQKMQTILDDWRQDKAGSKADEENYPPVELQQMKFVLAIVPFGIIISSVTLMFEWIQKVLTYKIFSKK